MDKQTSECCESSIRVSPQTGQIEFVPGPCWEMTELSMTPPDWKKRDAPDNYSDEYLERVRIVTLFTVGLLGALLLILLLACACLNNATVAEALGRKNHLPKKGIEGYFPFEHADANPDLNPLAYTLRSGANLIPPLLPAMNRLEIPIIIEPQMPQTSGMLSARSVSHLSLSPEAASKDGDYDSIRSVHMEDDPDSQLLDYFVAARASSGSFG